mgnify:CR=1 FL=1
MAPAATAPTIAAKARTNTIEWIGTRASPGVREIRVIAGEADQSSQRPIARHRERLSSVCESLAESHRLDVGVNTLPRFQR